MPNHSDDNITEDDLFSAFGLSAPEPQQLDLMTEVERQESRSQGASEIDSGVLVDIFANGAAEVRTDVKHSPNSERERLREAQLKEKRLRSKEWKRELDRQIEKAAAEREEAEREAARERAAKQAAAAKVNVQNRPVSTAARTEARPAASQSNPRNNIAANTTPAESRAQVDVRAQAQTQARIQAQAQVRAQSQQGQAQQAQRTSQAISQAQAQPRIQEVANTQTRQEVKTSSASQSVQAQNSQRIAAAESKSTAAKATSAPIKNAASAVKMPAREESRSRNLTDRSASSREIDKKPIDRPMPSRDLGPKPKDRPAPSRNLGAKSADAPAPSRELGSMKSIYPKKDERGIKIKPKPASDRMDAGRQSRPEPPSSGGSALGVTLIIIAVLCVLVAVSLLTGLWDISNL